MSITSLLPGALGFGTAPLGNMFRAIPDEEARRDRRGRLEPGHPLLRHRPLLRRGPVRDPPGRRPCRPTARRVRAQHQGRPRHPRRGGGPHRPRPGREGRPLRARPPEQDDQRLHGGRHPALHRGQPQAPEDRPPRHRVGARRRPGLLRRRLARPSTRPHAPAPSACCSGCATKASSRPGAWASTGSSRSSSPSTWTSPGPTPSSWPAATPSSTTTGPCSACCRPPPSRVSTSSSAGPTAPASSPAARTSSTSRPPRRSSPRSSGSRRSPTAHGVSVKAAALQFALAHPATAAVIPGATRPSRIAEDVAALAESVPVAFWAALRDEKLIAAHAPTA